MKEATSPTFRSSPRLLVIVALVVAGEAVFSLPFLVPRVFRPTLLDVFGITNLELGTAFSAYGMVAIVSYVLGGPLADRFSARTLMSIGLLVSALGGVCLASIPSLAVLRMLFAFWGVATILLFWAALIRATREWGGARSQGLAFGMLEGGRGLFAALLSSAAVFVFGSALPAEAESATMEQRKFALQVVIWIYTGFVIASAVLVWTCVPRLPPASSGDGHHRFSWRSAATVLSNKAIWLQGIIIVCAYTAFKGMDDFSLFARDGFGFNDVQAARVGTLALWTRPAAALGAGLLADRISAPRAVLFCFCGLLAGYLVIGCGWLAPSIPWTLYMLVVTTGVLVYALRGVYFALFGAARVPIALTGTATGMVSVVGYTPDVFAGPLMGYFTDGYPGMRGHEYFFGTLAAFSAVGVVATLLFRRACSGQHV